MSEQHKLNSLRWCFDENVKGFGFHSCMLYQFKEIGWLSMCWNVRHSQNRIWRFPCNNTSFDMRYLFLFKIIDNYKNFRYKNLSTVKSKWNDKLSMRGLFKLREKNYIHQSTDISFDYAYFTSCSLDNNTTYKS